MSTAQNRFITPEEYLAAERKATFKSEYLSLPSRFTRQLVGGETSFRIETGCFSV